MSAVYYSIGETAKIMGITVQTLRYYNKMGLVTPNYVNKETGYRYYTADQFHYIDRIRYLQELGLSLAEIAKILSTGSIDKLLNYLKSEKQKTDQEISKMQKHADDVQWYIDYFTYIKEDDDLVPGVPFKQNLGKRYLMVVKCYPYDTYEETHARLNTVRSAEPFHRLKFRRQFAIILDFDALMKKEVRRHYLGLYLREAPEFQSEHILEVPAGEYVCFRGRILTEDWDPSIVSNLFETIPKPLLVLSNEYEDSFSDFSHCMHEIQMLLR